MSKIRAAEGAACGVAVAQTWPDVTKIAHIHPDYSYGRNCFDHFSIVTKKLLPKTQNVSEAWPKLFSTDFTPHITKTLAKSLGQASETFRSEEHTSELQSHLNLVCRLLLEKKNIQC